MRIAKVTPHSLVYRFCAWLGCYLSVQAVPLGVAEFLDWAVESAALRLGSLPTISKRFEPAFLKVVYLHTSRPRCENMQNEI